MSQPTYQPSFILSFENKTGVEIKKHRFISMTPEASAIANVYPAENTGLALGVTVDNSDTKSINVQRGGVVLIELETGTTLTAGEALKVGASGLGRKHEGVGTIVAYSLEAITTSTQGDRVRAVLANA